jgi:DNA-binding SARP family transcriptional activator
MLKIEDDWVTMNGDASIWVDASLFEQSYQLCKGRPGRDLTPDMAQALQMAIQLYRGDLLEGWYQEWCLFERERYQGQYLTMLDKMLDYCEASCDYEGGVAYGERVLRCDRARERTHRRLMRLHWLIGDRTAALRQYERCVTALAEELDVKPSARTLALYQQIRADRAAPKACGEDDGVPVISEPVSPALIEMLARLRQMHNLLASLQRQVQRDIQAVEQMILYHR